MVAKAPSELRRRAASASRPMGRPVHRSKAPRVQRAPDRFAVVGSRAALRARARNHSRKRAGWERAPRASSSTGCGERGETDDRRLPPPGEPGKIGFRVGPARPAWILPPSLPQSHDTRCPSGSGRGSSRLATRKGIQASARRRESTRPCPVRPRPVQHVRRGGPRLNAARKPHRPSSNLKPACERETERGVAAERQAGSRRSSRLCSRTVWLQKSTSGARSLVARPRV